jgi:hypothetical protein
LQRVAGTSRTTTKPILENLRAQGVEIRTADVDNDSLETLTSLLRGVDILVSTARSDDLTVQFRLFDAAKAAGVGRVVSNDWGPYAPQGVMLIQDRVQFVDGVLDGACEGIWLTYLFHLPET